MLASFIRNTSVFVVQAAALHFVEKFFSVADDPSQSTKYRCINVRIREYFRLVVLHEENVVLLEAHLGTVFIHLNVKGQNLE